MTNEEAFIKWFDDFHIEEHPNYKELKDFAFAGWEARLVYMQEQNKSAEQSEPVAWMEVKEDAGYKEIKVWQEPVSKKSIALYTSPQRQQPLKRLDEGWMKIG